MRAIGASICLVIASACSAHAMDLDEALQRLRRLNALPGMAIPSSCPPGFGWTVFAPLDRPVDAYCQAEDSGEPVKKFSLRGNDGIAGVNAEIRGFQEGACTVAAMERFAGKAAAQIKTAKHGAPRALLVFDGLTGEAFCVEKGQNVSDLVLRLRLSTAKRADLARIDLDPKSDPVPAFLNRAEIGGTGHSVIVAGNPSRTSVMIPIPEDGSFLIPGEAFIRRRPSLIRVYDKTRKERAAAVIDPSSQETQDIDARSTALSLVGKPAKMDSSSFLSCESLVQAVHARLLSRDLEAIRLDPEFRRREQACRREIRAREEPPEEEGTKDQPASPEDAPKKLPEKPKPIAAPVPDTDIRLLGARPEHRDLMARQLGQAAGMLSRFPEEQRVKLMQVRGTRQFIWSPAEAAYYDVRSHAVQRFRVGGDTEELSPPKGFEFNWLGGGAYHEPLGRVFFLSSWHTGVHLSYEPASGIWRKHPITGRLGFSGAVYLPKAGKLYGIAYPFVVELDGDLAPVRAWDLGRGGPPVALSPNFTMRNADPHASWRLERSGDTLVAAPSVDGGGRLSFDPATGRVSAVQR